jgi:2,4-dienoyl-CoA reductase-like NADH-dependent reductase (Old Yellow Enzyme family)
LMSSELFSPLVLRSGGTLRNRVAKAAMEEGMAGDAQLPDERLIWLYRRWGAGGAGLLITGNVMVHAEALTKPGGIVLDDRAPLDPFARWAQAGKAGGAAMWMQVSHPGRQVQARMPGVVWAPSPVAIELGKHSKRFARPMAMTREQIGATVERFATTAAREAYFLELAAQLAETSPLPLMLTGGITRRETAEQVLANGVALVGMASAIAITPDLCSRWQEGREATEQLAPVTWSGKRLASAAGMALARHQMRRITRGGHPTGNTHPLYALVCDQRAGRRALGRYRAWLETRT